MKENPPVREDGKCAVCEGERHPEHSRRYAPLQAEADPFCSAVCARTFHGVEIATGPGQSVKGAA